MKMIPGKQYLLWCQRQCAIIAAKTHPLHSYVFAIPCVDSFQRIFQCSLKEGEFFVVYQGVDGLFKLTPSQVLEAAFTLGIAPNEVSVYYNNECRDAFGKPIEVTDG